MINGIMVFVDGTYQQIGTLHSARGVIATMRALITELERVEFENALKDIPRDVLTKALEEGNKTHATE